MARLERALDCVRELEVIRKEHRERCMSYFIFIPITSVLNITSQGRRICNLTPNHPLSLFLRHLAFSNERYH